MLQAIFTSGVDELTVHGLTQWDKNQQLQITLSSLPTIFQVHYSYKGCNEAYVVNAEANGGVATVLIPNLLLGQSKDAVAWIYVPDDSDGEETIKTIHLPITPRARPSDYAYTEIEIQSVNTAANYAITQGDYAYQKALEAVEAISNVDDAVAKANNAATKANSAAYTANTAAGTANAAAGNADASAAKIDNMTVSAEASETAGAQISEVNGAKHIAFSLPKGERGDTGATPNITFEVSTGAAGSDVELEQSGTAENPVVKLTIPRGDTGAVEGVDYYEGDPAPLGTASPGTSNGLARGNHVHPMPSAEDVGARPADWMPTAEDVGALPSDGTAANANMLNGKSAEEYALVAQLNYASPKMYGAVGDGVADDTAAIKAAIQANSGAILFPPGEYLISETIELPQTKYSSIILNGAIIRQTVALNPMIKIGSDDGSNYPMSVKGDGVIDMNGKGGIGLQIMNSAGYSHIDDIQVRRCANGIGILLGDGVDSARASLQVELNNVKIYGNDSRYESTALHVNAHDCFFNNLYLYLCKKGAVITGTGHSLNNVHIWGHAYEDWTVEQYTETVGIDVTGPCFFNYLYIDSVCNGLITNGANQVINSLYYQNDISQALGSEVLNKIITKPEAGKVIVTGAVLGEAKAESGMKNKVFYIEGASAATQQAADERCIINHTGLGKTYDIFDEANNRFVQKYSNRLIIPSSPVEANKLYLFGYVKAVADVLDLILYRKYGFCVKIRMRVDAGALTNYSVDILESNQTDVIHFYYGTTVEKYGVKWIPLYFSYEDASSYFTLYAKGENYGENGFYPCICTKAADLEKFDTVECTELMLETTANN